MHPINDAQRIMPAFLLTALLSVAPLSCASVGGPVTGTGPAMGYPPWIVDGTCLATEGDVQALFGLGAVRGIRNVALARSTADNRARAELARLLDAFVVQWLQACRAVTVAPSVEGPTSQDVVPLGAGSGSAAPGDKAFKNASVDLVKLLTAANLPAVQVVEHHFHAHDGAVFSLARLDVAHMVQHLQVLADLAAPLRTCLSTASTQVFAQLMQQQRPSARHEAMAPISAQKDARP